MKPAELKVVSLPSDQRAEAVVSPNARDLVVEGWVDPGTGILTLVFGNSSRMSLPLSVFERTAVGVTPDFEEFEIADHGQTLRFGKYEAAVDTIRSNPGFE